MNAYGRSRPVRTGVSHGVRRLTVNMNDSKHVMIIASIIDPINLRHKRITHRFSQRLKLGAPVGEHAVNRKLLTLPRGLNHHVMYRVVWERDALLFLNRWGGYPKW